MDSEVSSIEVTLVPNHSQDERRVPQDPEDPNSLKRQVYLYARKDMWEEAQSILNDHPDLLLRTPLTGSTGDTALHVAVGANSVKFVTGLLNIMNQQDLETKNLCEDTAFDIAAYAGNDEFFRIMIEKGKNLIVTPRRWNVLPVHLAALMGRHQTVQVLTSPTLLDIMSYANIEQLFFMTVKHGMFDVASTLFDKYPARLAVAREGSDHNDINCPTALHMLAQKRPEELYMTEDKDEGAGLQLLKKLWNRIRQLDHVGIFNLTIFPSLVLFDAIESGNVETVKWILYMNPELHTMKNFDEHTLLHYAVRYRRSSFFSFMLNMGIMNHILLAADKAGNNVLHFAAYPLEKEETKSSLRATTKMRRELAWFKEVEKKVPAELRTMRNKEGKTPKDLFYDKHYDLSVEVKDTAKGIAESGMLVAALVATVAFAAALVVPGDKNNAWYVVFILANAAALFTSSASILSFLSNFTASRFAQSEYVVWLHPSLILGPMLLLISIVTMVIAFAAAAFLIFDHTAKWAAYVVASMGVFPMLLFLLFHFSIFDTFLWSRFYRLS